MKLLIAGGGTGGHLFPAIAIAREFMKADKKNEVLFVGTKRGIENKVLIKEGFNLLNINVQPIAGKGIFGKVKALTTLPLSIVQSIILLKRFKPDFALGVGGYASGPVILGASLLRIRTGIQEQNIFPGMTNKILGKFVDAIFLAFKEAGMFFRNEKVQVTGNPIRESLFESKKKQAYENFMIDEGKFTIFVFGGSLGASSINKAITENLDTLDELKSSIQIVHQTGDKDYQSVKKAYENSGIKAFVAPFIFNMNDAYRVADVIICRAGATSISELAALEKPAILVPYPHAAGDHQKANAKALEDKGAAIMVEDKDLDEKLMGILADLFNNEQKLDALKQNISKFKKLNAAKYIVKTIERKEKVREEYV